LIAFYNIIDIYTNTYIKIYKDKCHTIENFKRNKFVILIVWRNFIVENYLLWIHVIYSEYLTWSGGSEINDSIRGSRFSLY